MNETPKTLPLSPKAAAFYKGVAAAQKITRELQPFIDGPEEPRVVERLWWARLGQQIQLADLGEEAEVDAFTTGMTTRVPRFYPRQLVVTLHGLDDADAELLDLSGLDVDNEDLPLMVLALVRRHVPTSLRDKITVAWEAR